MTEILRAVSERILEERTRKGIEEAVCETVSSDGSYRRAWMSEVKRGSQVVLREYGVGVETDAERSLTDTERTAVLSAAEDGESHVVYGETDASEDVYVATVPVRFEDVPYGVLGVASEVRLGEDGVEILERLADLVGFTINSAEMRKSLLSERSVELEFGVSDSRLFSVTVSEETSSRVGIERMVERPDGRFLQILTVERGTEEMLCEIADGFGKIDGCESVGGGSPGRRRWAVITSKPCIAAVIAEYGGDLETATAEDGEGTVVARLPPESDVSGLMESLESEYSGVEIIARRDPEGRPRETGDGRRDGAASFSAPTDSLTRRQSEVLETAYLSGFFESPRRKTSEEVAEMLGISQPTFSEHIREAERRLLSSILED